MANHLRDFLRFQDPAFRQDSGGYGAPPQDVLVTGRRPQQPQFDENYLRELMMQQEPPMPTRQRRQRPMPQRPQQSWGDLIPQLLGGGADVVNAYGGGRSDYQGRIMGMQQRGRDQSFEDALRERAAMESEDRYGEADDWRRYSGQVGSQERGFNRAMKYQELDLMLKAIQKQQAETGKQDAFQKFMYEQAAKAKFEEAGGPSDVEESLKKAMLQARNPEELLSLQAAAQQRRAPMDEKAAEESEINSVLKELVQRAMRAPGYGDPYGYGGLGLQSQLRPEAERIVRERRKKSATPKK